MQVAESSQTETPEEYKETVADIATVEKVDQPSGLGVERELTDYSQFNIGSVNTADMSGVGNVQIDAGLASSDHTGQLVMSDIKVPLSDAQKEDIASYITKDGSGLYSPKVNWARNKNKIDETQYYVLLATVGKMVEDKLNEGNAGRYSVIASMPSMELLNEAGLDVYWTTDDYGFLSIAGDFVIQDLQRQTEVEEIRVYTLYYDGIYLAIKE